MGSPAMPVLWICGPPCVGKSTTGWNLYDGLMAAGRSVAYVDIDQLGICYPARPWDADRHDLKARNLGGVLKNFRETGARLAIVSGVVTPEAVPIYVDGCEGSAIRFCRLRLNRHELATRNRAMREQIAEVIRNWSAGMSASRKSCATPSTSRR